MVAKSRTSTKMKWEQRELKTKPMADDLHPALQAGLIIFVSITPATQLYEAEAVAWTWLLIGVVLMIAAAGPVAASQYGQHIGNWFKSITVAERFIAIIIAAVVIWTTQWVFRPPALEMNSLVLGGMIGLFAYFVTDVATSYWTPNTAS